MNLKIIEKKEDPLLSRIKIKSEIIFEKATPSREEIKSKLASTLSKDEKLIEVKGIYTDYGLRKAESLAYVYDNAESLKKIEGEKKTEAKKKEGSEESKKEESKPEAKEDSKPKEPEKENK